MKMVWPVWFLFPVMITACLALPPAEEQPVGEGQKNLDAIRSILLSHPYRSSSRPPAESQPMGNSKAWPPDWLAAFFAPPSTESSLGDDRPPYLFHPYLFHPSERLRPSRSSAQDFRISVPWKPTKPPPVAPEEAFRPVPAYFFPIPIAPGYPNTLRCVPDYSGGQRCHAH